MLERLTWTRSAAIVAEACTGHASISAHKMTSIPLEISSLVSQVCLQWPQAFPSFTEHTSNPGPQALAAHADARSSKARLNTL